MASGGHRLAAPAGTASRRSRSGLNGPFSASRATLLDADGRIVLWSPQAESCTGTPRRRRSGSYAALLPCVRRTGMGDQEVRRVMETGRAGAARFPSGARTGAPGCGSCANTRLLDRPRRLLRPRARHDSPTLREVERVSPCHPADLPVPFGLAILDTDLRYLAVNPALERMHGLPRKSTSATPTARS